MRGRAEGQQDNIHDTAAQRPGTTAAALAEALFVQHATGIAEIDLAAGCALRFNSYLVSLLGFDAGHPQAHLLVLLAANLADSEPSQPEAQIARADGSLVRVRLARLPIGPGRALLLVAGAPAQAAAAETQDYRDIYENISEGIYRSSLDGRPVSANPALVRLNGYATEAELLAAVDDLGNGWYVAPGRHAEFARLLFEQGRVHDFVSEVYRHKTGERIWISENARLVRDGATGAPLFYEGTIREVTETVRRLQLEQRLRAIIDTIADGVITTDTEGRILTANRAACETFGWSAAEIAGRPLSASLVEPGGAPLAPGVAPERRARAVRADGSVFAIDVAVAEADDPDGRMLIWCVRDATARLRYEDGLFQAKEAAERSNRAKSEFLAMMSHELRTPLNAVIGMAGLLLDSALDDTSHRHAETLRDAADHLMQVINDVLDFSKLDAGRMEFETIAFAPENVVNTALDLLAHRARAKGLDLGAYVAPDVPARVAGDPGRLRQVLINLIGNAIKFTERGAVLVEVERLPSDGAGILLGVSVRDTGVGISADRLPDLFKEFTQLDSSVSRRFGGTGLGLAISSRLVAGMGGSISAGSEPGQGSHFRFTVRLAEPADESPAAFERRSKVRMNGLRVLVADDHDVSRSVFVRQLIARGARVGAAADAASAMTELRSAAAAGDPYQAAVIDYMMPGADGPALGEAIRKVAALAPIRLVLVTAALLDNGARVAAGRGFARVLDKPVPPDVLARALLGQAERQAPAPAPAAAPADTLRRPPAPASPPPAGQHSLSILVAEDNLTNQLVIRAMIERLGHRAHVVGAGEAAVAAVRDLPFDVVLMDVMMPGMDGIEATRMIRAMPPPLGKLPVFGLTAHIAPEDHAIFRAAGMDDILTKPVTAKALAGVLAPVVAATVVAAPGTVAAGA